MIKTVSFLLLCLISVATISAPNQALSYSPSTLIQESSLIQESTSIQKSPNDQRQYLALTLKNQLQVLLISDPATDKASAAMDVYVGSSDDPDEFPGLAHFLEHMLFLGTEKYPTPDAYQKFISDHGGSHNAYTSLQHTNYFFDIQANYLEEALDRFSQQFTSPLFNAEYVDREVNAVHSEYTSKIKDDGRRFFDAMKTTLPNNHPYSKFSVGNLETLKDLPDKSLRDALLDFYQAHYSANKMRLVVLGKEPLDVLKSWVIDRFSAIENRDIPVRPITQPFFDPDALPKQLNVQSIMDKRSLTLAFPIPSDAEYVQSKPVNYIANLIGHEGKGSLLSKLKSMDLVDSLSAGSQFDTRTNAMFIVSMTLTQKGLAEYQTILSIVFDYIDLLKNKGIQKLYYDEQATLLDIAFKFKEKSEPIHFTSVLATTLQETAPEKVLIESFELSHYDPNLYTEYLHYINPENMLVALSAKDLEVDKQTQWYQTPYKTFKLHAEQLAQLKVRTKHNDLHIPEANEFIPHDITLQKAANSSQPELLLGRDGFDIWYALDASFGTPKANLFLTLRSPLSNSSAEHTNKTDILVSLLKDKLNEYSYPAYLAGLNFEIYQHMRGVTIKISGYHDKQSNLLLKILNTLKNGSFAEERFVIIKERLKRQLENAKDKKPFEQAISLTQNLIINPSWNEQQRLAALDRLSFEEISQFQQAFTENLQAILFVNGNITRASALNIGNQVNAIIMQGAQKTKVDRSKIIKLNGEKTWVAALEVAHPDTGYVYYVQGQDDSLEEQAKFLLLNQILSTEFYGSLRTEKQLGYVVFSTSFNLLDVPAIAFIIQSPNAAFDTLFEENIQFLTSQIQALEEVSELELKRYKKAVVTRLLKQDNTLYSLSNKYWQDIDRENFNFNTNKQIADAVERLETADIQETLMRIIENKGSSLLVYTDKNLKILEEKSTNFKMLDAVSKEKLSNF